MKMIICTKSGKRQDIELCFECKNRCESAIDDSDDSYMVADKEYFAKNKMSKYYIRGKIGGEIESFEEYEGVCVLNLEEGYRVRIPINAKGELQQICVTDGDFPITDIIKQKAGNLIENLNSEFFK